MKELKYSMLFLVFFHSLLMLGFAQGSVERKKKDFNINKQGLALDGYDPVSYFLGKPEKGRKDFSIKIQGIIFQFCNQQNEEKFKETPENYEPQYGGWCAYAMGVKGERVDVDPQTFSIMQGKLYLFYNKFFNNTLILWKKDEMALKAKADANWMKIIH